MSDAQAQAAEKNIPLLAAAAIMAGQKDDGWEQRVLTHAKELKLMASPGSRVMKAVLEFDGIAADGSEMDIKHFTGTVLNIKREESSTRGIVSVWTGDGPQHSKYGSLTNPRKHPLTKVATPGVEHFRTERTDSDQSVRDLANRIGQQLVGHDVNFTLKMEEGKDGTKYRVLIAVQDLGPTKSEGAKQLLGMV